MKNILSATMVANNPKANKPPKAHSASPSPTSPTPSCPSHRPACSRGFWAGRGAVGDGGCGSHCNKGGGSNPNVLQAAPPIPPKPPPVAPAGQPLRRGLYHSVSFTERLDLLTTSPDVATARRDRGCGCGDNWNRKDTHDDGSDENDGGGGAIKHSPRPLYSIPHSRSDLGRESLWIRDEQNRKQTFDDVPCGCSPATVFSRRIPHSHSDLERRRDQTGGGTGSKCTGGASRGPWRPRRALEEAELSAAVTDWARPPTQLARGTTTPHSVVPLPAASLVAIAGAAAASSVPLVAVAAGGEAVRGGGVRDLQCCQRRHSAHSATGGFAGRTKRGDSHLQDAASRVSSCDCGRALSGRWSGARAVSPSLITDSGVPAVTSTTPHVTALKATTAGTNVSVSGSPLSARSPATKRQTLRVIATLTPDGLPPDYFVPPHHNDKDINKAGAGCHGNGGLDPDPYGTACESAVLGSVRARRRRLCSSGGVEDSVGGEAGGGPRGYRGRPVRRSQSASGPHTPHHSTCTSSNSQSVDSSSGSTSSSVSGLLPPRSSRSRSITPPPPTRRSVHTATSSTAPNSPCATPLLQGKRAAHLPPVEVLPVSLSSPSDKTPGDIRDLVFGGGRHNRQQKLQDKQRPMGKGSIVRQEGEDPSPSRGAGSKSGLQRECGQSESSDGVRSSSTSGGARSSVKVSNSAWEGKSRITSGTSYTTRLPSSDPGGSPLPTRNAHGVTCGIVPPAPVTPGPQPSSQAPPSSKALNPSKGVMTSESSPSRKAMEVTGVMTPPPVIRGSSMPPVRVRSSSGGGSSSPGGLTPDRTSSPSPGERQITLPLPEKNICLTVYMRRWSTFHDQR